MKTIGDPGANANGDRGAGVIKICGLTRIEDALQASELGVDFLGLVFCRASARSIAPNAAAQLVRVAGAVSARWIGVFVDETADDILRVAEVAGLGGVQLHGRESPDVVERLRREGLLVIKAHRVREPEDVQGLERWTPDVHLLDAYVAGAAGGTGERFDWNLAKGVPTDRRILLAGGLTGSNVAEAIATVRPWGVDVSTGVEAMPGRKDAEKVCRFVAAAREAFARCGERGEGRAR